MGDYRLAFESSGMLCLAAALLALAINRQTRRPVELVTAG